MSPLEFSTWPLWWQERARAFHRAHTIAQVRQREDEAWVQRFNKLHPGGS